MAKSQKDGAWAAPLIIFTITLMCGISSVIIGTEVYNYIYSDNVTPTELPFWMKVLTALLTPTIAIAVGVIAYRQYVVNKTKLRLDLFERRLKVYDAIQEVLVEVTMDDPIANQTIAKLHDARRGSLFLFSAEVHDAIKNISDKVFRFKVIIRQLKDMQRRGLGGTPAWDALYDQHDDALDWFHREQDNIHSLMSPYLSFPDH